jgi:DNA segregation ATPase FtsK/SpoIIIE, S-DNA-T family
MAATKTQSKSRKPAGKTTQASPKRNQNGARSKGGAKSRKQPPPTRATRSLVASRPGLRSVRDLEPHHIDLIALAIIAVGIFLGGIEYFGWAGGTLGHGAESGLELLAGKLAYLFPVVLILGGARVLARGMQFAPATRPLRSGAICLGLALTLMFAAGLIGPGKSPQGAILASQTIKPRGGVIGGLLYDGASHLLSSAGADILAVFLLIAGIVLLSGATFASVVNNSRRHAQTMIGSRSGSATRRAEIRAARIRTGEDGDGQAYGGDGEPYYAEFHAENEPGFKVPDPEGSRLIVRATHVEAPSVDTYEGVDGQRSFDVHELTPEEAALRDDDFSTPEFRDFIERGRRNAAAAAGADEAATAQHPVPPAAAVDSGGETSADDIYAHEFEPEPEPEVPMPEDLDDGRTAGPGREVEAEDLTPQGRYRGSVTDDPEFVWKVPSGRFLVRSTGEAAKPDTAGQAQTAKALVEALGHFGIEAKVVGQVAGPHITRYEIRLAPGIKMSKVSNLKDDLAYALAATDIRILAPIPGKTAVGIEVPNARRRIVHLGDVFQEPPEGWSPLTVWLGKDISGKAIGADLAKMPHLLVAGTTGAGKSACVNSMLSSVLMRATPHEVRLVLVDPKQVELNHYESIPHLLTPVITNPKVAANALQNLVKEMELRYGIMALARTRSLPELNKVRESRGESTFPYILCVIDELADLMMIAPADVEDSIIRLAQKARAVGIHLVLATQSPRVDVITGMIKANVPSRIAFAVSSQTDSRVILDQGGAESLLGQGDMLFSPVGTNKLQRIQGAYIDEEQIAEITESWRKQGEPELREELLEEVAPEEETPSKDEDDGFDPDEDPLLEEAISLVAQMGTASTSMLQRRLRLGYTRAGRLIDMLERRGIISGYEGSKPRQVLITEGDIPRVLVSLAQTGKGGPAGQAASGNSAAAAPEPAPAADRADAVAAPEPEPEDPSGELG